MGPRQPPGRRILVGDAGHPPRPRLRIPDWAGCIVETAHSGSETLALARSNAYDAVLADIRMPDKDGYEIFCDLKAHRPDLPVVLTTAFGYDPSHTIVKCRAEGLKSVLFKPFTPEKLTQEVQQVFAGNSEG